MTKELLIVRLCYNWLIPLQILAAIFVDRAIEPYLIYYGINYAWASVVILSSCVVLESVGIKYWILEQSRDLKEMIKEVLKEMKDEDRARL